MFRNNIVVGSEVGFELSTVFTATGIPPIWDHNLVFDNGTNYSGMSDPTGVNGNLSADPQFVDMAEPDLHLHSTSPAIDNGTATDAPPQDFDRVNRPQDGEGDGVATVDIGAFEALTQGLPVITGGSVKVTEGDTGPVTARVPVTLSRASVRTVTVHWATESGGATSPGDFTAASGTLVFAPGVTSRSIPVQVNGDRLDEPNEDFRVDLSAPSKAVVNGAGLGTIRILDDDVRPSISTESASTTEGDEGGHALVLPVRLSAPSGRTVSVAYATSRETAKPGVDYSSTSGIVTFAPGSTLGRVKIWVKGDRLREPSETFTVRYFDVTNASIPSADVRVTGTIVDDD